MATALLLNSGGKDSLATAILMSCAGWELHSLYVDMGQLNTSEARRVARLVGETYCKSHEEMVLHLPRVLIIQHPNGVRGVAHQGTLLHGIAASVAASRGDIDRIVSGHRAGSLSSQFPDLINATLKQSRMSPYIHVDFPVFAFSDEQVWDLVKDEPIWKETVTCGQWPPCGSCGRCRLRASWLAR